MPSDTLGILLISGRHDRAHYAYIVAAGAAAINRQVILFATGMGCHALLEDWSGLEDVAADAGLRAAGVAGLAELRAACQELGVRMVACEAGLRGAGLAGARLAAGVEVAGVVTFLEAARHGQMITL